MEHTHKEFAASLRLAASGEAFSFDCYCTLEGAIRKDWLRQFLGTTFTLRYFSRTDVETFFLLVADALEAGDIDPPGYAVTLAIGDVVCLDTKQEEKVITSSRSNSLCQVKYAVNGCGWYSRQQLRLLRRADYASLEQVNRILSDEETFTIE